LWESQKANEEKIERELELLGKAYLGFL